MMAATKRLDAVGAARVRELRAQLRTIESDGAGAVETLVRGMRDALRTESTAAYGVQQLCEEHQQLSFVSTAGLASCFTTGFSGYVPTQKVVWASYNPVRPEPRQRNRVVAWTPDELEAQSAPIYRELYPHIGLLGLHQMRVLVCEGPSLLAWVGGWQSTPFERRQVDVLRALLPDLQRRLALERQLEYGARSSMLGVALDAIGRAAFVVDGRGRIVDANVLARGLVASEGRAVREELLAAIKRRAEHPRWAVTPVALRGGGVEYLVLARAWNGDRVAHQVTRASQRWGLTDRQTEVLAKLIEGNANQTIAAMLGVSERTVEVHVTALLEKAQVESRSALIANAYQLE
jgi:DNA-binding CsgD family transcriptional regulator